MANTNTLLDAFATHLSTLSVCDVVALFHHNLVSVALTLFIALLTGVHLISHSRRKVYLLDFACYKPHPDLAMSREKFMQVSDQAGTFTAETLAFQKRVLERSGLGQKTSLPAALTMQVPPNLCVSEARKETEAVVFGAVGELLAKTRVRTKDIGILVVNCGTFHLTPSLSAMIVNRYKLRGNVLSYNLGGMGCSAGVISIDLAKHLLQVNPNTYALVVSMENLTLNWYLGNKRSMLVSNCLFRSGGAAILLSNRSSDHRRSKYILLHTIRTHRGADDKSYFSVYQHEDDTGRVGIELSKDMGAVAGDGLKANITTLAPLVLPLSEKLLFLATLSARNILKMKDVKPYVPDLTKAFDHFCIHAGGKAVLDVVEKNLGLSEKNMEASRMTLYRFGNTSSSSPWYELAYMEAKGSVKKGDRTWQIAFGSGFKCNSAVWRALRTIDPSEEKNAWSDEIHEFPVTAD